MAAAVAVDRIAGRARRRVALAAEAAREVVPHVFIFFGGLGVVRGPVAVLAGRRGMGSRWYTGEAFLALPSACFECFELILAAVLLRFCESAAGFREVFLKLAALVVIVRWLLMGARTRFASASVCRR